MPRIRFGLFEFDPASGELWREGVPVRLQPQPARVLALLAGRAGELVTRDEFRQQIWGDDTFVDFERGLNFCIAQIRSALRDSAESPRFIETLPRRGYRFIAPTAAVLAPAFQRVADAGAGPLTHAPSSRRRTRLMVIAGSVAVAALALAWVAMLVLGLERPRAASTAIPIAVLPFDNETGDAAFDEVARGVPDAIVARLASADRVRSFTVIGNAAILGRPRGSRDLRAIGDELGVAYVVLGQVKRDAERVRVIAHLIRTADQGHVWAKTFDRPAFTLAVQAAMAEEVAKNVTDRLAGP